MITALLIKLVQALGFAVDLDGNHKHPRKSRKMSMSVFTFAPVILFGAVTFLFMFSNALHNHDKLGETLGIMGLAAQFMLLFLFRSAYLQQKQRERTKNEAE